MLLKEARSHLQGNYFFYAVTTFAFLLPLSRAALSIFALLLPLMWLIDAGIKKSFKEDIKKLFSSQVTVLLFSYFGFMILSLLWGEDNSNLWLTRAFMISFLLFITPVVIMRIRVEQTERIISAFLLGMLISEIVSYGIFFEWWNYHGKPTSNPTPFMAHIEYSVLLVFTSLLLLSRIMHLKDNKQRLLYVLFFITVTINLFINGGRTGQIAFFIAIFVVLIFNLRHLLLSLFIASLIGLVVATLAWNYSDTFNTRMHRIADEVKKVLVKKEYADNSLGVRIGSYILAYEVIKENPLFGAGWVGHQPLMKEKAVGSYGDLSYLIPYIDFQNQYLFVMAQFGAAGLLLFLWLFYKIAKLKIESLSFKNVKIIYISVILLYFFSEALIHQFVSAFSALIIGLLVVHASADPSVRQ